MSQQFLGGITAADFLKNYWNKKPLLIKQAVPNISEYAEFNEFLELSEDEEIETRIVYEKGGDYDWQAKAGPFKSKDFKKNALWTLMVHSLEVINPDFFELKKNLEFTPNWHFDDIMATISKKGASVGAHIDDYSVFILQGRGSRKWMLQTNPNPEYIPDIDIRLLKEFTPDTEWILEPGDMIYIPPTVAHHGITLEDSVSYSFGFKSIRYKNLLDMHTTNLMAAYEDESYQDKHMPLQDDQLELKDYVIDEIHADFMKMMGNKELFKKTLLTFLSNPKNIQNTESPEFDHDEIVGGIHAQAPLIRDMWAKIVVNHTHDAKKINVAINGNLLTLNPETYLSLKPRFLCDCAEIEPLNDLELKNTELVETLALLLENNVFYFSLSEESEE